MSVFFLFILTAGLLVILGAGQYQDTVDTMENNHEIRTAASYLAEKVHQHNSEDIAVTDFCGQDAMAVSEDSGGKTYTTYIYYYDGTLRELLTDQKSGYHLSSGQIITTLTDFTISQKTDGLLEIHLSGSDNIRHTQYLYPQQMSGKEVP